MKLHKGILIIQKILLGVLAIVFLANLYILVMQLVFHNDLPKVFGGAQLIVVSGSMQPALNVGDFLIIHEQKEYQVGDIITYRSEGSLITHRLISVEKETLVTQGDANNAADDPILLSQVEGKVIVCLPKLGNFILLLKTPVGILGLVFLGVFLTEAPDIFDHFRRHKSHS